MTDSGMVTPALGRHRAETSSKLCHQSSGVPRRDSLSSMFRFKSEGSMHIRPTHHVEMSELGSGRPVVNPQHLRACVTPEAGEGRHLRAKHQEGPSPSNPKCLQTPQHTWGPRSTAELAGRGTSESVEILKTGPEWTAFCQPVFRQGL